MSTVRSGKWFTLLLGASALGLLAMSLPLAKHARLVPLWVLAVTLPLLLLQIGMDWWPGAAGRLRLNEPLDLFSTEAFRQKIPSNLTVSPADRTAVWPIMLWVLGMPALVAVFGVLVAIPLHALLFLLIRFKVSLLTALAAAAALGGVTVGALHVLGG